MPDSTSWQTLDPAAMAGLPRAVRPWITLSTSMTAQLRRSVGADVHVEILRSGCGALHADEVGFFDHAGTQAHVREVCLHGAGRPMLAARTVYVSRRLANDPALAHLGTRPLGELLFRGDVAPHWSRREFARLGEGSPLGYLVARYAAAEVRSCWGRRTLFWLDGEPLLVTEIFLPPVPHFPTPRPAPQSVSGPELRR